MGESSDTPLKLEFDCRIRLKFGRAAISSDAGLLVLRRLMPIWDPQRWPTRTHPLSAPSRVASSRT